MKYNLIKAKFRDKNINNNKTLELFKLSVGNNIINLKYNNNKNIGKMIYESSINKEIKILNKIFILNNMKRIKMIINNKQYDLEESIENQNQFCKIKILVLDNIIYLDSMFKDCKSLTGVYNFQKLITKHLKTIYNLFDGCISLLYIDDISNWKINNINNISKLFYQCSSLDILPDISRWNTTNINDMFSLFGECISLKKIPDISKWNLTNTINISGMFDGCYSLEKIPDISKWNVKEDI